MRRLSSAGIFVASLLAGTIAAQAGNESWVSNNGTDAGTCPRTAACGPFNSLMTRPTTTPINVLTSRNCGPVTITKPISIVADGVEAVINSLVRGYPSYVCHFGDRVSKGCRSKPRGCCSAKVPTL